MRGGIDRLNPIQRSHRHEMAAEPVDADLKTPAETGEQPAFERRDGCRLACFAATIGGAHAPRAVDDDGDDVLLRAELCDDDGRLPEQKQDQRNHCGLHSPDCQPRPPAEARRRIAQAHANEQSKSSRGRGNQHGQQPSGPRAEKHESALREDRARVFEEELKHVRFEPGGMDRRRFPSGAKAQNHFASRVRHD